MDYKTFSKVVFELSSIGVEHVQIIGGEPLVLKNRIKKMISVLCQISLSIFIVSLIC